MTRTARPPNSRHRLCKVKGAGAAAALEPTGFQRELAYTELVNVLVRGYVKVKLHSTGQSKTFETAISKKDSRHLNQYGLASLEDAAAVVDAHSRSQGKREMNRPAAPNSGERAPNVVGTSSRRGWQYDPLLNMLVHDLTDDGLYFVCIPPKPPKHWIAVPVFRRMQARSCSFDYVTTDQPETDEDGNTVYTDYVKVGPLHTSREVPLAENGRPIVHTSVWRTAAVFETPPAVHYQGEPGEQFGAQVEAVVQEVAGEEPVHRQGEQFEAQVEAVVQEAAGEWVPQSNEEESPDEGWEAALQDVMELLDEEIGVKDSSYIASKGGCSRGGKQRTR